MSPPDNPPPDRVSSRTSALYTSLLTMSELKMVSCVAQALVPPKATNSASQATTFCLMWPISLRCIVASSLGAAAARAPPVG